MSTMIVKKSKYLCGTVDIHGSKNSSLPILACSILSDEPSVFKNVPFLTDTENMLSLLNSLGFETSRDESTVTVIPSAETTCKASEDFSGKLRASFLVAGPMLARFGKIDIGYPGGCVIGNRPIDLHLKGFENLGAKAETRRGKISVFADSLTGCRIYLDFPSVGATENLIMASVLANGETVIENAATEPEIQDLTECLNEMGAEIWGGGTENIKINGVKKLKGANHRIIPDRIEAGTYMAAVAAAKGEVDLRNVICPHLKPITAKLREMGAIIEEGENTLKICCDKSLKPTDIITLPYPGFPTDMQAPFSVLLSQSKGTCLLTESVFENRFRHIPELIKMGASIKIDGRCAVIEGSRLSGAGVCSTDLRSGAALVIAGLCASGETTVNNADNILRGYQDLDKNLRNLGAYAKMIP